MFFKVPLNGVLSFMATVGTTPDMVKPTADCQKLLVTVEAEARDDQVTQSLVDNPGGIGIITFTDESGDTPQLTMVDFQAFNDQ